MASNKQISNAMIILALIIGVVAGYANYSGESTLLFACLGAGLVVLIIAYHFLEKHGDNETGRKIDKY